MVAPQASVPRSANVVLPTTLPDGPYHVFVDVDIQDGVAETDETNNDAIGNVFTLTAPDLAVDSVVLPGAISIGASGLPPVWRY